MPLGEKTKGGWAIGEEVSRMTPQSSVVWMEGPLPGDQEASYRQGNFQMLVSQP